MIVSPVIVPVAPVTVAVHVEAAPIAMGLVHVTDVLVGVKVGE